MDATGSIRDLSRIVPDIGGGTLSPEGLEVIRSAELARLPLLHQPLRFGVPVAGIGKIIAIGLNHTDHAVEASEPMPEEPLIFMKATSALNGPYDPVILPRGESKTDWEVELALIIGTPAHYIKVEQAMDYIAGFTICNDISERAFQLERGGQFVKGKSCDTFAPLGPWLVTREEVAEPQRLSMWLDVNGQAMQRGSSANMKFDVAMLVSYVSQFMSLQPGDVITTGTPAGVGWGKKPPVYLKPGDLMSLGIDGLGEQYQRCLAWKAAPGSARP